MNCAIYARYSSEKQSASSIEDQVRKCREYAAKNGWAVLDQHVYSDAAISGATDERQALKRMLTAATSRPPQFDCVLVDDTSRLSRSLGDVDRIAKELKFAGIRIVYVAQGFDSESESAGMLTAIYGGINEQYLVDLGKKTFRGVEGLAQRKLHTGGRCFGYRNVPIEDATRTDSHGRPVINGVRLEVEPHQAKVIRRIYSLYAEGRSLKYISKLLNAEGVESPQPQKGRISQSWCPSSIRTILHNERYRGLVVWGKKKKIRSPKTGKRIYRARPESEWVRNEIPEQRIVSDELWQRSAARRETVKRIYADANRPKGLMHSTAMNSAYLFSGVLKCSECGANLTILWGKGRNKTSQTYGCPQNWNRGETVCGNTVRVRRDELEATLLAGLQEQVLREDVIDYVLEKFESGLLKELGKMSRELDKMQRRKEQLEKELGNLVTALAAGQSSPTIMQAIADREREISAITDRAVSSTENSVRDRIGKMRVAAREKMTDLRKLLGRDVTVARAALLKHVEKITIEPSGKAIVAAGNWKLLGEATQGWCRGPESNWLRPPFQGGALPMSYPGSSTQIV
jgi:site-specific DNA recombinase